MAGSAPEGSQFDTRQFDAKMSELLQADGGQEFFTSYDEVFESFDAMGLQENLLRGIYAYGFEKPSACVGGSSVREDQRILSSGVHVEA